MTEQQSSFPYVCLVGAAGSGKSTVAGELLLDATAPVGRVVTTTSRTPRPGEVPGVSYHFLAPDVFRQRVSEGAFFEWEETHHNLYGTSYAALNEVKIQGKAPLLIIDIRGALTFKRQFPKETVIVFLTPSSGEALGRRLAVRGDSEEQRVIRLDTARREYDMLIAEPGAVDYVVINDVVAEAVRSVRAVVEAELCRGVRMGTPFIQRVRNEIHSS